MSNLQADDFSFKTLNLKDDYQGKVTATLIAANANKGKGKSILYIHGFNDYFFQYHLAEELLNHGYDFHAIDLRKYGRSKMEHQYLCYCKSLDEYYEEISIAIKEIIKKGNESVILMGHSTGGLTVSLYANDGPEKKSVSALILNSPFFDLNLPKGEIIGLKVLTKILPAIVPFAKIKNAVAPGYGKSLHKDQKGEWDYNLDWKPTYGITAYFAWFKAIIAGQKKLRKKSAITIPILNMHSSRTIATKNVKKEDFHTTDMVLDVEHIKEIGPKLGSKVTNLEVKDGVHDLFLSKKQVRESAFTEMFKWLEKNQ